MNCPSCAKEVIADRFFCTWCEVLMPNPSAGTKAGLFRRWFSAAIDPLLAILLYFAVAVPVAGIFAAGTGGSGGGAAFGIVLVTIGYGIFFLTMLSKGTTPGKWLLGEQVVNKQDGGFPGLGKMFVRELPGKFISALFLGVGYFWAIFDPDGQAWHDKIAGTVVVKKSSYGDLHSTLKTREVSFVSQPKYQPLRMKAADGLCPNCAGKNPATSSFCGHCGARLI
jgi:uncharacterized RDD family membrane protein YckC